MSQEETLEVRRLTSADAAAFRALRLQALARAPEAYGSALADWVDAPIDRFVARLEGSWVFGAFRRGDLVGIAALDREKGGHVRHRGQVTAVYVAVQARRGGVCRALMAAIIDRARAEGLVQLELAVAAGNGAALRLYAGLGFGEMGRVPGALLCNGVFADEILMVLPL